MSSEPRPDPESVPHREYAAHPDPQPVPDTVAYLTGRWNVERVVHDLRADTEGRFRGTADFRPDETGDGLLQVEEGELTWGGTVHPASRTLRVRPRPDGSAEVTFADGRPFHDLDLRTGRWTAVHPCDPDRYEGTFIVVAADEWRLEWRVAGPEKHQVLRSVYRRRG